jgi:hypothetical protein
MDQAMNERVEESEKNHIKLTVVKASIIIVTYESSDLGLSLVNDNHLQPS